MKTDNKHLKKVVSTNSLLKWPFSYFAIKQIIKYIYHGNLTIAISFGLFFLILFYCFLVDTVLLCYNKNVMKYFFLFSEPKFESLKFHSAV